MRLLIIWISQARTSPMQLFPLWAGLAALSVPTYTDMLCRQLYA